MRSGTCVRGVTVRDEVGGKGKVCELYLRWGLHDQGMFTSNNRSTHVHSDLLFEPRLCEPPLFFHLATRKEVQRLVGDMAILQLAVRQFYQGHDTRPCLQFLLIPLRLIRVCLK